MSQIKTQIDKLIANTNIADRYRTILALYPKNPRYKELPYHNAEHVRAVLNLFEILRKLSGKGFNKQQLKNVELALAFHDINHSGFGDAHQDEEGETNIGKALAAFYAWQDDKKLSTDDRHAVIAFIEATRYPHDEVAVPDGSPDIDALIGLVRDADILWGMLPGNAEQCMIGLWLEQRNAGAEVSQDVFEILKRQLHFIRDYQPFTAAGRTFKNAMFDQATLAWSQTALDYQRQLELAAQVKDMPAADIQALAYALANKHRLGRSSYP
ncbi:hypothetical protein LUCX_144 [Xanthomonas phage vB_XciM_LucasX]|nr:hypothetical protein LUCX_144 [Xanthomonas phage vB_XciM_LucasX]